MRLTASFLLRFSVLLLLTLAAAARAQDFSPQRQFPTSWDRVQVFVDQLDGGLAAAQRRFAATHYVGTQKQTSNLIDAIRVYNPDFLMLQYRLDRGPAQRPPVCFSTVRRRGTVGG